TTAFAIAFMVATLYFLTRATIAIAVAFYLPRRYPRLAHQQGRRLEGIIAPLLARFGLEQPTLLQSPSPYLSCCAFGLRHQYLLVSRGLLEGLDDEHLEAVLAHELAHFLRRDQYLNLVILALRSFLFFNPLVHLLCREISQEQELACDALAIRMGQRPLNYAQSLLIVCRQGSRVPTLWDPATSGFLTRSATMRRRVTAVLERGGMEGPERRPLLFAVTGSLSLGLFFVC
ncbi:MAG: M56 family metallopeptidase, partial [Dehalococcoidia bacterium]|nr:M56 family metallopeptidase [Dehalococcoidia bacterium]